MKRKPLEDRIRISEIEGNDLMRAKRTVSIVLAVIMVVAMIVPMLLNAFY